MRETGPVRKELSGEEAAPYIGFARTLLGVLKNQMKFGQLSQGKLARTLPDGTLIAVQSIFGMDKINIVAAAIPQPQEEPAEALPPPREIEVPVEILVPQELDLEYTNVVVVGTCAATGITYGVVWNGGGRVMHVLPLLAGSTGTFPTDISDDCRTVVGYSTMSDGSERAWKWTASGGMVLIDSLGTRNENRAVAVSATGKVIVGTASDGSDTVAWRWEESTGTVALPTGGAATAATGLSPNGRYIVGTSTSGADTDGVVWFDGEEPILIPRPGTSTAVLAPAPPFDMTVDKSLPVDVTDKGVVCGNAQHREYVEAPFTIVDVYSPDRMGRGGTTITSAGSEYYYDDTIPPPIFTFNVVTGGYSLESGGGEATASAAKKANLIVGTRAYGVLENYHQTIYSGWSTGDPLDYSTYLQQYGYANLLSNRDYLQFLNTVGQAFVMDEGVQTLLGEQTTATDVTEDGLHVVGGRVAGGVTLPVLWRSVNNRVDLDLAPGTSSGNATAVANTRTYFSTDPASPTSTI